MFKLINKIKEVKEDVIFVGGVSELLQGCRESTKDIDICVTNLDGLEKLGNINKFKTNSPTSKSGLRAGIEDNEYLIDIFIESDLPDYVIINGIKCETIESMIKEYGRVISEMNNPLKISSKNKMINKLQNLQKHK